MKRLAIVGGGAAGLAAAIAAGDAALQAGVPLSVSVFERDDRVGRSILATGNGRCNFSNEFVEAGDYHNEAFVGAALDELHAQRGSLAVQEFFEGCGLAWRQEADGRRYPLANKASAVLDVLRASAARAGAREVCDWRVKKVVAPKSSGKPFTLQREDGLFERADAVIVACGGRALDAIDVPGLSRIRQFPVLGPLRVADGNRAFVRELDNIRVRCRVSLMREVDDERKGQLAREGSGERKGQPAREGDAGRRVIASETGELMFRKYGVSGICVFNLSRFARPADVLEIDFLRSGDLEAAIDLFSRRYEVLAERFGRDLSYDDMLRGLVLPRVADALFKDAHIRGTDACGKRGVRRLAELLTQCRLVVEGIADPDLCQVRRGGFAVESFDPSTMAARSVPGLYAAGEALDVDGPCGGFNLHWAWASGLLAGRAAAEGLLDGDNAND